MPSVRVETNLSHGFFPEQLMPLFVYFLAEIFSKDKNVMKWTFETDKRMSLGPDNEDGHDGHFFWVDIALFDLFEDAEICREAMPKIFEFLTTQTDLKSHEIYVTFTPLKRWHVGRHNQTAG